MPTCACDTRCGEPMTAREIIFPAAALAAAGAVYLAVRPQTGWIVGPCGLVEAFAAADAQAHGYPRAGLPATLAPPGIPRGRALSVSEHAAVAVQVRAARQGAPGYGWTVAHADVRRHPTRPECAYPVAGTALALPQAAQHVEALPAEWTPAAPVP